MNDRIDVDALTYDSRGLIPVIVQQWDTHEVLMMAWMDRRAVAATVAEQRTVFWSRSRQTYWRKGETSGHIQHLRSLGTDCDADTLLVEVDQVGAACHTGTHSCFDGRTLWSADGGEEQHA